MMRHMERRPRRRLINRGDTFTLIEIERGEIELVQVTPAPEPERERDEPWARLGGDDG